MQLLGLFGIIRKSFKIIISCPKIFAQITLTLILPLTFIFLGHLEISNSLFQDIKHTEYQKHVSNPATLEYNNLSNKVVFELINLLLFKVAYFTILLTLSLLSTAAVVYTIASIYTGGELTFKKVMRIVPKVWKRLMITFLCMLAAFFVYNLIALVLIMVICFVIFPYKTFGVVPLCIVLIIYVMGLVYMTVIWQLASVVSVLESSYGFKALKKSNDLIKGNKGVAIAIFFMLSMSLVLIQFLFESFVVHGSPLDTWKRVGFGVLCSLLLLTFFLFGLVIKTIFYLVCKSYHHENIDKGDLSNHLESYQGEYEPLSGKDVQLEQCQV